LYPSAPGAKILLPVSTLLAFFFAAGLLSPRAAGTAADPVFTTYAAPLHRSEYLVDQGYHLRFYSPPEPLAFTTDTAGDVWCRHPEGAQGRIDATSRGVAFLHAESPEKLSETPPASFTGRFRIVRAVAREEDPPKKLASAVKEPLRKSEEDLIDYVFSREPTWGWGHDGQVFHESLSMLAYALFDPRARWTPSASSWTRRTGTATFPTASAPMRWGRFP
jgi:hypothetical protein